MKYRDKTTQGLLKCAITVVVKQSGKLGVKVHNWKLHLNYARESTKGRQLPRAFSLAKMAEQVMVVFSFPDR